MAKTTQSIEDRKAQNGPIEPNPGTLLELAVLELGDMRAEVSELSRKVQELHERCLALEGGEQ